MESWSYATPTRLDRSWMRFNGSGFVSRSEGFGSVPIFTTSNRPSSLAACSQRCLVRTCFAKPSPWRDAWSTTAWVSHASVTRVLSPRSLSSFGVRELPLQLTPQRTAHFPTTKATPPSVFLTRTSGVHHLWTSIPPLIQRLSSRFAAQSLSVRAMMWSDRSHQR